MSPNVKTRTGEEIIFLTYILFSLPRMEEIVRSTVKIIEQAKNIKSGETVLDRGTGFIIRGGGVSTNDGGIVFIDTEGVGHGVYHPDEYLGVGEELARKYATTYDWPIIKENYAIEH